MARRGDDHDDVASRVTQVKDGSLRLASYWYLGASQVVGTKYAENNVMRHQWAAGAGVTSTYPDLDRFGRVIHDRWTKDLSTDKDFYSVDRTWDEASNITLAEDNVHTGFDVSYTIDDLNRLTRAQEGTWSGSITSEKRDQEWTLTQTGNWDFEWLDLNGDGDWSDANEHQDDRTHNDVNELTGRDTDDNGTDNFTLSYDAAGNLTDDGESYTYEWDAFYRLRKIKNRSNAALVAEYTYNGLGFRLGEHADTDTDGDVDSNDKWFYSAYDERWRWIATFRESDTSPKEEFVPHQAGFSGFGGSSYIDLVILRDKDANTAWTSASDGVLEQRHYYCQNWHSDVSALVTAGGLLQEWDKYLSYGTPFGLPGGDTDSDGDCDATDVTQIQTWISAPAYDLRGDIDLDGDVDATDKSTVQGSYQGLSAGLTSLSAVASRFAHAGLLRVSTAALYYARNRWHSAALGRWISRDPMNTVSGVSTYELLVGSPLTRMDPSGLTVLIHDTPESAGYITNKLKCLRDCYYDCCKSILASGATPNPLKKPCADVVAVEDSNLTHSVKIHYGLWSTPKPGEQPKKLAGQNTCNAGTGPTGSSTEIDPLGGWPLGITYLHEMQHAADCDQGHSDLDPDDDEQHKQLTTNAQSIEDACHCHSKCSVNTVTVKRIASLEKYHDLYVGLHTNSLGVKCGLPHP